MRPIVLIVKILLNNQDLVKRSEWKLVDTSDVSYVINFQIILDIVNIQLLDKIYK